VRVCVCVCVCVLVCSVGTGPTLDYFALSTPTHCIVFNGGKINAAVF
jgi:hypothetical protein